MPASCLGGPPRGRLPSRRRATAPCERGAAPGSRRPQSRPALGSVAGVAWPRDKHGYLDMAATARAPADWGPPPTQPQPDPAAPGGSWGARAAWPPPPSSNLHQQMHYHPNAGFQPPPPKRFLVAGKCSTAKEDEKKDDTEIWSNVEVPNAFLGPNLWDKTLPYDTDLKYVDLDEFLSENGMPNDGLGTGHLAASSFCHTGLALGPLPPQVTKRERSPSPDCLSPDPINPPSPADSTFSMASSGRDFDPRTRAFSDEELKPQPMIKKSRKQFVPDDLKDDKYWARRRKNNMAAKRSRDARRMKENQIALRAGFLEKENMALRQELESVKRENSIFREKLSKYTTEVCVRTDTH